jgi:hypothetical protein
MGQFYNIDYPTAEGAVSLIKGQSYYIEAYHINWAASGFFNIDVEVPNTDNTLFLQSYQVD